MRGQGALDPGLVLPPAARLLWGRCGSGGSLEAEEPAWSGPAVGRRAAARRGRRGLAVPVAVVVAASPPPFTPPVMVI